MGTAACDCTCERWSNRGIPQEMRQTQNRLIFPRLSHRINVLPQSCRPELRGVAEEWSGRWESNPRLKLGKLGYYHYTTPASGRFNHRIAPEGKAGACARLPGA